MAFYQNIEIQNWRQQSKYPFDMSSTLKLDQHIFPVNWIQSLNLQVYKAVFPLHISRIVSADNTVQLQVVDRQSELQCVIQLKEDENKILDAYSCIAGQMRTSPQLFPWLKQLVGGTVYGTMQLLDTALIIDSQAITCTAFKGYTGISVNNTYVGQSAILNFQRNVTLSKQASGIRMDAFGNYPATYQKQIKLQKVNGVQLKGKQLLIKHRSLADLRVVTDSENITLTGVTDVS